MFDRYNIIDDIDLAQAVAKHESGTPATDSAPLSSSPAPSAA
jgi:hypothetical protein